MTTITEAIIGIILASTISFIPATAAEISETNIIDSNADVNSKISKIISEYVEKYPQYSFEINDTFNIISKTDNFLFL